MPTLTYTPLATITLGSPTALVTFSSLPTIYETFVLVINCLGDSGTDALVKMKLNNSTTGYVGLVLYNSGTIIDADSGITDNGLRVVSKGFMNNTKRVFANVDITNLQTGSDVLILVRGYAEGSSNEFTGSLKDVSSVTSIELLPSTGSFGATSSFSLYGILGA